VRHPEFRNATFMNLQARNVAFLNRGAVRGAGSGVAALLEP
jgi:hypothetical protein